MTGRRDDRDEGRRGGRAISAHIHQLAGLAILVTGAAGFVGRRLVEVLLGGGVRVHALSRAAHDDPRTGITWHRADLADADAAHRLVAAVRPDAVLHLASLVDGAPDARLVLPTLHANTVATVHLLEACRRVVPDVPVVLAGTMMEPRAGEPSDVAGSPYAMSKWAASGYARMYRELYGLPTVTLRLHMVYGPGQAEPRKLLPHTALSVLRGQRPALSSGRWETDWIFVDDVAHAVIAAAAAARDGAVVADVGSGRPVSVREVVSTLAAELCDDPQLGWGELPDRPLEHPRVADPATWPAIGWRPAIELGDGLRHTAAWLRAEVERGAPWTAHAPSS